MSRTLAHDDDGNLLIDVRGPRFAGAVTMAVLGVALVVQGTPGTVLVAVQAAVFAVSTVFGLRYSPYGTVFRIIKDRFDLGPPPAVEPEAPPRFSQLCGLVFTGAGLVAFVAGAPTVGWVLVGIVLALSAVRAIADFCVGCELYLLGQRLRRTRPSTG